MSKAEVVEMQSRIDLGIRLAQKRLLERARHDDLSLVLNVNGQVLEVPAKDVASFN